MVPNWKATPAKVFTPEKKRGPEYFQLIRPVRLRFTFPPYWMATPI
jgi:hypothetical protein